MQRHLEKNLHIARRLQIMRMLQKNKRKVENRAARKHSTEPHKKQPKTFLDLYLSPRPIDKLSDMIKKRFPELTVYKDNPVSKLKTLRVDMLSDIILKQYPQLR